VQIFASREAMLKKLKELLAEQTELQKKNRLLEVWIIKHMRKVRFKQFSKFYTSNSISILHYNQLQVLFLYGLA